MRVGSIGDPLQLFHFRGVTGARGDFRFLGVAFGLGARE